MELYKFVNYFLIPTLEVGESKLNFFLSERRS